MYDEPNSVPVGNQSPTFNDNFLNNQKGINNLKYLWKGFERDNAGNWQKTDASETNRIMNDKGIHWAIQVMESYLDKVFQSTSWDSENMNWQIRKAYRSVWYGMIYQYRNFGINKINVQVVCNQVLSRIHAMLMASRGGGIRNYLSTTQQLQEIRQTQPQQERRGLFGGIGSMFKGTNNGGQM